MKFHKYHEALSAFRDFKKCIPSTNFRIDVVVKLLNLFYLSLCLIEWGRIQQGLHVAGEGWNSATDNEIAHFVTMFTEMLDQHRTNV